LSLRRDSTWHLLFSIGYDSGTENIIRYPIMWQNLSPGANYIRARAGQGAGV